MAIRSTVGSMLESAIGRERTNNLRQLERRTRNALATRIAMEPVKTYEARPKGKALARFKTSSTSLNGVIGATGPNGSSVISRPLSETLVNTVGS